MKKLLILVLVFNSIAIQSQEKPDKYKLPELKMKLNEDGTHFIKAGMVAQFWGRYNESNNGTTVDGYVKNSTSDLGL